MVWVFGGYPCGMYPDLKLTREAFVPSLITGERAMADKGYKDEKHFILPNAQNTNLHGLIMARHETLNRRLKQFLETSLQTFTPKASDDCARSC